LRVISANFSSYTFISSIRTHTVTGNYAAGVNLYGEGDGPSLSFNPLTLTLEDDSDGYFKPGFPYKGRVGECFSKYTLNVF